MKKLHDINEVLAKMPRSVIAIAQADDPDMLGVVAQAGARGIADFILIGDEEGICRTADTQGADISKSTIIHCVGDAQCAAKAVSLVRSGEASMPMKGLLSTATFMRAILNKEEGLRTDNLISQITVANNPEQDGLVFITDCAMNVYPDLSQKVQILQNAVGVCHTFGIQTPKVACITAVETVNEAMPETLEAAILSKMCDRGQIKGCNVDGPFALDNAISYASAEHKGIKGDVAGHADILLMSDIKMGNVLHKAITYFAKQNIASIIVGTSAPIIMTSRSDSVEDKVLSIAYCSYMSMKNSVR